MRLLYDKLCACQFTLLAVVMVLSICPLASAESRPLDLVPSQFYEEDRLELIGQSQSVEFLRFGDMDLDGYPDVVGAVRDTSSIRVFLQGPNAAEEYLIFTDNTFNSETDFAPIFELMDVDLDGDLDLLILNHKGCVLLLQNPGEFKDMLFEVPQQLLCLDSTSTPSFFRAYGREEPYLSFVVGQKDFGSTLWKAAPNGTYVSEFITSQYLSGVMIDPNLDGSRWLITNDNDTVHLNCLDDTSLPTYSIVDVGADITKVFMADAGDITGDLYPVRLPFYLYSYLFVAEFSVCCCCCCFVPYQLSRCLFRACVFVVFSVL